MSTATVSKELMELCNDLNLDDLTLKQFMKNFRKELVRGLKEPKSDSSLKCFITFINSLPKGNESGRFLSLHFASILLRVSIISLRKGTFDLRAKQYIIPKSLTTSTGEELFDYLAECVYEFTAGKNINTHGLALGFTFGFPLLQTGLKSGIATAWAKEFKCTGVIGRDVVSLLENSLDKIPDLKVEVAALINDTVGTLLSCAWKRPTCKVGVILDAGANICYVEKVKDVPKYRGQAPDNDIIVINTECGNMGSNGCIDYLRTVWDHEVDRNTKNPGTNVFEKMVANRYLGELVRRVLVTAVEKNIILGGQSTLNLNTIDSFDSKYITLISKDPVAVARQALVFLGYEPKAQDCADLQYICEVAWTRSAHLLAAAIASVLQHMQCPEVAVGFDGLFYRSHGIMQGLVQSKIKELIDLPMEIRYQMVDDRGGLGAALAASLASRDEDTGEGNDVANQSSQREEEDDIVQSRISSVMNDKVLSSSAEKSVPRTKSSSLSTEKSEKPRKSQEYRSTSSHDIRPKKMSKANTDGIDSESEKGSRKSHGQHPGSIRSVSIKSDEGTDQEVKKTSKINKSRESSISKSSKVNKSQSVTEKQVSKDFILKDVDPGKSSKTAKEGKSTSKNPNDSPSKTDAKYKKSRGK